MATRKSPTVRRRRLGQELQSLRKSKAMTVEEVATELEWSASKVSRIETTSIRVSTVDLRALLDVYDVDDKDHRNGLLELGRESRETAWWQQLDDRTPVSAFKSYVGFEAEARRIRTYEPAVVPGLLQTEGYMRAILQVMFTADARIDEMIKLRMERQTIWSRRDDPVSLTAYIDEAALRRPLGGKNRATVMRDQIDRLLVASDLSNVKVFVLPFENGAHPAMTGAFTVLGLPHPDDSDVVYLEAVNFGVLLNDTENLTYYDKVLDAVQEECLGQEKSQAFLRTARDEYAAQI